MLYTYFQNWLATGTSDATVRLWNLRLEDLMDLAGRNLTQEEWNQYFPGQDYRKTCPDLPIHPSAIQANP